MNIVAAVVMFISVMSNQGFTCEIDEMAEFNAVVSCQNEHVGTTEWLDVRDVSPILMSYFQVT